MLQAIALNANQELRRTGIALLVRLCLYGLLLSLFILAQVVQPYIYNVSISFPLLGTLAVAFLSHLIVLEREAKGLKLLFALDVLLITSLLYATEVSNSLFLFLYFVLIFLSGFVFAFVGAFYVALASGIGFTLVALLDPRLETTNLIFLVLMNNSAFLLSAYLSGFLSREIEVTDEALVQTGARLRSTEEFNKIILAQMPAAVLVCDVQGKLLRANRSAEELLGSEPNLAEIFLNFKGNEQLKSLSAANGKAFELRRPETDVQTRMILRCQVNQLQSVDDELYILLIQDMTEVQALEEQLRQQEKLAAVGQLAAGIAHEIRNPLASISGSIQMMQQMSASSDDKRLMNIILKETDRLDGLITEFLDYSRPDAPMDEEFVLTKLVHSVVDQVKLDQSLVATLIFESEADHRIRGSADKLKQALMNIIINAVHATEKTEDPRVMLRLRDEGIKLCLVVEDNGCGMTEATKSRMFEPFLTTKPKGTGLGLAVTHKILQGHKAEIYVDSEVGRGTRFELRFPKLS